MAIQIKNINVTCLEQHCRVLWCDKTMEAAVVDPGGVSDEIVSFVNNNNLILKYILLTHSHFDHCGGVNYLKKYFKNSCFLAHECEKDMRKNVREMMMMVNIYDSLCEPCPEPDMYLQDNHTIDIGDEKFVVLFTPGHSPGGVSYYNEKNKILLSGDTLFCGTIGRTDFLGGDFSKIISSIKNKLFVLPGDTIVYPGHGEDTTILNEKKTNPYFL